MTNILRSPKAWGPIFVVGDLPGALDVCSLGQFVVSAGVQYVPQERRFWSCTVKAFLYG